MGRKEVLEYFGNKADEYDDVDSQVYWQLSDELLEWLLETHVFEAVGGSFSLLDAGGGTGRWSVPALEAHPESTGMLFDISAEMIAQAREKAHERGIESRLNFVRGDLHEITATVDRTFDAVYSFHNVLGFVERPGEVVSNLYDLLDSGGRFVCVVPNLYHGVYFNTKLGNLEMAEQLVEREHGTFTHEMPDMHFFTPERIAGMLTEAGFSGVETYGFPVSIYPGYDETQLHGNTESIESRLRDGESYERILAVEKELVRREEAVARGNNIFAVGTR